nr:TIGR02391 family protein [uncultured Draconibacterium sp.]
MAVPSINEGTLNQISELIKDYITNRDIDQLLESANIENINPSGSKRDRIFDALKQKQRQDKCANNVINFIQNVLNPSRYNDELTFQRERESINSKLLFVGLEIGEDGIARATEKAKTVSEALTRSRKIKRKIGELNIHHEVIRFCEEEWLKDNYFHAILEITKSVAERLRLLSGYLTDGSELVDNCYGLGKENKPMLAFNTLQSESEQSEHKGFSNLLKGFFSMYRNPKAHNPKINENTQLSELTEVLLIASIIHRKIDITQKTGWK